jgi:hypothetical protein
VLSKSDRLKVFIKRLQAAPPADSDDRALQLLSAVLNAVEDEFSGVPYKPEPWSDDGRIYPPTVRNERPSVERPQLRRYRSAKHVTLIGPNGAIRIEDLAGAALLDKAGADGLKALEVSSPKT